MNIIYAIKSLEYTEVILFASFYWSQDMFVVLFHKYLPFECNNYHSENSL